MYHDLNVTWTANQAELQRTVNFLAELDYNVVALNYTISGKLPTDLTSPIPLSLPFPVPTKLRILRRCTLTLSDPSQNRRLTSLSQEYDILALRPTNEKSLQLACQSLDCDLISLDLTQRFPFYFRHKTLSPALARGLRFEIGYAGAVADPSLGSQARRNLIQNAVSLIRATRGRGIVLSSEAGRALQLRAPADVVNLVTVWGMKVDRGLEAVRNEARAVVVQAEMKRGSFRGVVGVVYGGEKEAVVPKEGRKVVVGKAKEKSSAQVDGSKSKVEEDVADSKKRKLGENTQEDKPMSNRAKKRAAKKAKLEANGPGTLD